MSRAENFIQENTKDCSNIFEGYYPNGKQAYFPWIHPKQARKAVEIAREEVYEWLKNNIYMYNGECEGDRKAIIEDLKQAMKDE
jgi:hypothetical protein